MMEYSKVANTDLDISELSFGCMSLELEKGQDHVTKLIKHAYESGINFFDTADLYNKGLNEKMLGEAIKPFREDVIVATKVGNVWREDGSGWDWNPSKEHILNEVNESLRRLQTDYLDLYMLHGGTIEDPIDEIIDAFETLKNKGKIRAYGISSIRPNTIREWVKKSNMDCVMMQYSLLDRRPEEEVLGLLDENDISVITRGTLAKGLLIDKAPKAYLDHNESQVKKMQDALNDTRDPIGSAMGYVLNQPAVTSVVAGIRTNDQLIQLLDHFPDNSKRRASSSLNSILEPIFYHKHR